MENITCFLCLSDCNSPWKCYILLKHIDYNPGISFVRKHRVSCTETSGNISFFPVYQNIGERAINWWIKYWRMS